MTNREVTVRRAQEGHVRVAVIRRRNDQDPQPAAVERKLQADVTAWLRERRAAR